MADLDEHPPNVTYSVGEFGRGDNNFGLGLDAERGELSGGGLAVIALRGSVA